MKKIAFTKMHGTGNDFIMVVERAAAGRRFWTRSRVRAVCDRHTGIGADGLIVLNPRGRGRYAFAIFNADGSRAETCVNGLRCAAFLLADPPAESLWRAGHGHRMTFETLVGPITTQVVRTAGQTAIVRVDLGIPEYAARTLAPLRFGRRRFPVTAISVGNPHLVVFVDDLEFDWPLAAAAVQHRIGGPQGVNVEFAHVVNRRAIELRIFERGVGPTLSSGSGATAAVFAALRENRVDNSVKVIMPGGVLNLGYDPKTDRVYLTGRATVVFCGEVGVA